MNEDLRVLGSAAEMQHSRSYYTILGAIMKSTYLFAALAASVAFIGIGCAAGPEVSSASNPSAAVVADPEIVAAQVAISAFPDRASGHVQLAGAHIRLARRTGDHSHYTNAAEAIERALEIAPADVPARKLKASVMLSDHEFAQGLEIATQLEEEVPNDAFIYGLLADANTELGNYEKGVEWAQKMVDLRPNSSSYARVANLRSLHGDHRGAVEAYKLAARTADPADQEAVAYCLAQLGSEYWKHGSYDDSERTFDEALSVLPKYDLALAGKARTLAAKARFEEAAELMMSANSIAPQTSNVVLLGDIYQRMGREDLALAQYRLAENGEKHFPYTHDAHRVALYWADKGINLEQALTIARDDHAVQKDLYASDTYAWCLYKNGDTHEARKIIKEALRLGPNDALIAYHAGMIENAAGDKESARRYLSLALKMNPQFDIVQAAKAAETLRSLEK